VSVSLRLGAKLVSQHTCVCGSLIQPNGLHGLSCRRSACRQCHHHAKNAILARTLRSVNVPAMLEPQGLSEGISCPDGMTLVPWSGGWTMVWDLTCPDTLAPSHLSKTIFQAAAAASMAEVRKCSKYQDISYTHLSIPVAVETMGVWAQGQHILLRFLEGVCLLPPRTSDRHPS